MKTALVTGSAGFIGRHMAQELQSRGWWTYGYDIAEDDDCHECFRGDDWEQLDLVVHCAYHVGGRASIDGVNVNLMKNLQLDSAMFEWAIRTKQRRVLYFSSSAAYPIFLQSKSMHEAVGPISLHEEYIRLDLVEQPDADYGWAKLTGERLAASARKNGLAVSVVRPFSGYGEDQSLDYPFPSIVRRAKEGDLTVWGPRGQTRDWVHVEDVCNAALAVVESGTADPVNICTGRGVEMGELMHLAGKIFWDMSDVDVYYWPEQITYDESKPTGAFYRVGDPTRMLNYYEPKVSLEEGIRRALRT